ncbi:MAG: hypothetical protein QOD06_2527 [Candidatus Binatota bacterium]|nr:hypothetical protein [Candidatus Binatota bacterium]
MVFRRCLPARGRVAVAAACAAALVLAARVHSQETDDRPPPAQTPGGDARELVEKADAAAAAGDFEKARSLYERATQADRGFIPAWRGLGWSLHRLGRKREAMAVWQDVLKVTPGEPSLLVAIAQAHEQDGDWKRALAAYGEALASDPKNRSARMGRARVLLAQKNYAGAEREVRAILDRDSHDVDARVTLAEIYQRTGRTKEAARIVETLASRRPDARYFPFLARAMLELGRTREAIDYFRRSLRDKPGDRGLTLGLARAYTRAQDFAAAERTLSEYAAKHPEDDDVRRDLAETAAIAGKPEEAEREWRELVRRKPDDAAIRLKLARALFASGQDEEAIAQVHDVLKREPENIGALTMLAEEALFRDRHEEAIRSLEQLAALQPSAARYAELGQVHLSRANVLEEQGRDDQARIEYDAAVQAFRKGKEVDPTATDVRLGEVTALRLQGKTDQTIAAARQLLERHPHLEQPRRELHEAYFARGEYDQAARQLAILRKDFPNNLRLEQLYARALFAAGDQATAISTVERVLQSPIQPSVPVLLYHGISDTGRDGAIPVAKFRDQLQALGRAGYQSITLRDLIDFLEGGTGLPKKPVLITFDDARADSFRFADPVLQETGFRAEMFVPVAEVGAHGAYTAGWKTLVEMQRNGRWDMQCHGNFAHRPIPLDAEGHTGRFLTNRKWLEDEHRLETPDEFATRVEEDYRQCKEELEKQVPGAQVVGYAYPFGDLGQKALTNDPGAFALNQKSAAKTYALAFVQDPADFVTRASSKFTMPRFEVPQDFDGERLLERVRRADPVVSTSLLLADLYAWSGRYAKSVAIYDRLAAHEVDRAELLAKEAQVLAWSGDLAGAQEKAEAARRLRPDDPQILQRLARIQRETGPTAEIEAAYFEDNRDRSHVSIGPAARMDVGHGVTVGARYRYLDFSQDGFDPRLVHGAADAPLPEPVPGAEPTSADLEASGHQAEAEVDVALGGRNRLSVSAGVASFSDRTSGAELGDPDPFPVADALLTLGVADRVDVWLGANRTYVATAAAILDDVGSTGGLGRVRVRVWDPFSIFVHQSIDAYDDGDNRRNTTVARGLVEVVHVPSVEFGYQYVYDDTKEQDPRFYTPDGFMSHEAVLSLSGDTSDRRVRGELSVSAGTGRERHGSSEFQASVAGTCEVDVTDHVSLFVGGGRSQAAEFRSFQVRGGAAVHF